MGCERGLLAARQELSVPILALAREHDRVTVAAAPRMGGAA